MKRVYIVNENSVKEHLMDVLGSAECQLLEDLELETMDTSPIVENEFVLVVIDSQSEVEKTFNIRITDCTEEK